MSNILRTFRQPGDWKNSLVFILLALLFGVIRTLVSYKGFGYEDQVEQLPLIYRSFDSAYLQNDFFVNSGLGSIARTNYIRFIRLFTGSPDQLPLLFFVFTMILNAGIALVTFLTGRTLFRTNLSGLVAAALVMLVPTFHLGASPHLFVTYFIPSSLATPLVLLAILLAIHQRIAWSMLAGGAASLVHPLFGLETMALVLFAWIVSVLLQVKQSQNEDPEKDPMQKEGLQKKQYQDKWLHKGAVQSLAVKLIMPTLLFTVFALVSILPQLKQPFRLDTEQFIHIIGYFRHPHHYIPGSFPATHYLLFLLFLSAFGYTWLALKKTMNSYHRHFILVLNLSILAACFAGYLLVEVIPIRLAAMAQTFRLLFFLKWTGLLFFSGFIVRFFTEKQARKGTRMLTGAALVLFVVALFAKGLRAQTNAEYGENTGEKTLLSGEIANTPGQEAEEIAAFARQHTPNGAVFLTPHDFGFFRLSAERAIVVDFKSFPFTDRAMLEWYERINDCYGAPEPLNGSGFENETLMRSNYKSLNDTRLKTIQKQYNFSYAVLFAETETRYETVFSNEKYKIIRLN